MLNVNVVELKNRLRNYLWLVKSGEEIVIWERNLPTAKLVPFSADRSREEELLVAKGKMRLPTSPIRVADLLKIPTGKVSGSQGIQALLKEREEGR